VQFEILYLQQEQRKDARNEKLHNPAL
jgi:hypothetical protein